MKGSGCNTHKMKIRFSWNFSSWKNAVAGFSKPDTEISMQIDGATLYAQLRKEKLGGIVTLKFVTWTKRDYFSFPSYQLEELRDILDELIEARSNETVHRLE